MSFEGFPRELIVFLIELGKNNNREWFQAHRDDYENFLVEPAREFVVSSDKTPYKTYLDLWLWQGDGPSRERPGYFLRLSPETLTLGAGTHGFSDATLDHPRADWLRHSGLFATVEQPLPPATFSDQLPGLCVEHYQRVAPLQQWLVDLLAD
jgi:uncharacterized protein (DUF2461 family)